MIDENNLPEEEKKLRDNAGAAIKGKEAIHPIEKDLQTVQKKADEVKQKEDEFREKQ